MATQQSTIHAVHEFKKAPFGYRLTATGVLGIKDAEELKFEMLEKLVLEKQPFSLLIDIRGLLPIKPRVIKIIKEIQHACSLMSIIRVAIIVQSSGAEIGANHASMEALTKSYDRVIDAGKYPDWEARAMAWLEYSIEPVRDNE